MIAWEKEHETISIECNITNPNGWKCNYCSNDYVRDDSKQLMQSVRLWMLGNEDANAKS